MKDCREVRHRWPPPSPLLPINIIGSHPSLSLSVPDTYIRYSSWSLLSLKALTLLSRSSDWPPRRRWRSSVWSIWRHMFCPCDHQTVSLRTLLGPEGLGLRKHTNTKCKQLRQQITVHKTNTKPQKPPQAKKHKCICLEGKTKTETLAVLTEHLLFLSPFNGQTHTPAYTLGSVSANDPDTVGTG